jgi:putative transposase
VGDRTEPRTLTVLGFDLKRGIAERLTDNLRTLRRLRAAGYQVGALRGQRLVHAIPLQRYGCGQTYRFDFARNRVRIQKLGWFRVLGLHQLPADAEITTAVLVRKPCGYYLHVTCYLPNDHQAASPRIGHAIGIDFGVSSKLTLSNGMKIDFAIHDTPRVKRLKRRLSRTQPGSRNRARLQVLLRKAYERLSNRRRDVHNKVLALLRRYERVVFQDDSIKAWSALFGRQVYPSGIGGLKSRLKTGLVAPVIVKRVEPTTGECWACGNRCKLALSDRVMACACGWHGDRDVNAARVILRKGLGLSPDQAVGLDRPELTPPEREAAARILGSTPYIRVSLPR